jgi:hypothetical protein
VGENRAKRRLCGPFDSIPLRVDRRSVEKLPFLIDVSKQGNQRTLRGNGGRGPI